MAFRERVLVVKVNKFYFFIAEEVQVLGCKISCAKKKNPTTLFSLTEFSFNVTQLRLTLITYSTSSAFFSHPFLFGLPLSLVALSHTMMSMR